MYRYSTYMHCTSGVYNGCTSIYTTSIKDDSLVLAWYMEEMLFPTAPSPPKMLSITRILHAGIELNWLPPTDPNGEVHYVIYYTPEGGTEQSIDTGSNLTHYNLTGLERNRVYTNIAVETLNSTGRTYRSAVIAWYNHPLSGKLCA